MKIGLLTYHAVYNFGANLQALSTYSFLIKKKIDVIVIDFFPEELENAFSKVVPEIQILAHRNFVEKNFSLTRRCRNSKDVALVIEENNIDTIIIGSDAVLQHYPLLARIQFAPSMRSLKWLRIQKTKYETNFPNPFWGDFLNYLNTPIKSAMMSVSCQNTNYKFILGKIRQKINLQIMKFTFISVRDKRTQQLIEHISKGEIIPQISPDPVFAFNVNFELIPPKNEVIAKFNLPEKYYLLSFDSNRSVSNEWVQKFDEISRTKGYHCVALPMPGGVNFENSLDYRIELPLNPLDWYCLIKYSSGYIGEKMHPLIVSMHNNVPIFSFDNYGILTLKLFINHKSSKIYQILEKANMLKNRVSVLRKISYGPPKPEIIHKIMEQYNFAVGKKFSEQMLQEYILMMDQLLNKLKLN